jgi:hypothetical protein
MEDEGSEVGREARGRGFLYDARRRYIEARRSTRIFAAFVGLLLLGFVAYIVLASTATFVAIDANDDAAHKTAPQPITPAPAKK